MKVTKRIKTIIKAYKGAKRQTLAEKLHQEIPELRAIEKAIRKYYKVSSTVYYVNEEYKDAFQKKEYVNGFYNTKGDYAIVFIDDNYNYIKHVTTLCHEMTHAYQNYYMNDEYKASCKALHNKEVTYEEAWHEVHAKEQAEEMCEYFLGYYDVAI